MRTALSIAESALYPTSKAVDKEVLALLRSREALRARLASGNFLNRISGQRCGRGGKPGRIAVRVAL